RLQPRGVAREDLARRHVRHRAQRRHAGQAAAAADRNRSSRSAAAADGLGRRLQVCRRVAPPSPAGSLGPPGRARNCWHNYLTQTLFQSRQTRIGSVCVSAFFRRGNPFINASERASAAVRPSGGPALVVPIETERHVFGRKWSRRTIWIAAGSVLVLAMAATVLMRARVVPAVAQVRFSDLLRHLDRSAVAEVAVNGDTLDFKLKTGQTFRTVAPPNYVTANTAFVPDLVKHNIRLDVRSAPEQ